MQSRASGSSSTMSTRAVAVATEVSMTLGTDSDIALQHARVIWQQKARAHSASWHVGDVDRSDVRPVQLRQPSPRVREPDALARRATAGRMQPVAAVTHRQLEMQPAPPRRDTKLRGTWAPPDAVTQRVLHQRLQNQ